MVGETLEQHCEIEFNKIRATAFRNARFEKDNDASSDFIFIMTKIYCFHKDEKRKRNDQRKK